MIIHLAPPDDEEGVVTIHLPANPQGGVATNPSPEPVVDAQVTVPDTELTPALSPHSLNEETMDGEGNVVLDVNEGDALAQVPGQVDVDSLPASPPPGKGLGAPDAPSLDVAVEVIVVGQVLDEVPGPT